MCFQALQKTLEISPGNVHILLSIPGELGIQVLADPWNFFLSFLPVWVVAVAAGVRWVGAVLTDTCQSFSLTFSDDYNLSFHLPFPLDLEAWSKSGTTLWMP
ncbi:hypothetical protein MJG53_018643 [Ovis ammon polii x Ovis aries]|uniref:Uncharacterized protein n=1 Tax=Ovis ammon polii x Ovis aries TaxID=2918886 RepID=A0ACB9U4K0_9CETA|nr:hypothetical protein MJT46_018370 [Ovis ammon polii x Ovis aries]KAI4557890.1 hypothetical protein MJG53_018643 [Ovis ammon polii x Ovis aries]